jgi:hypothetical protein
MQSGGWIALLRLVPPAQQGNLVLTTTCGSEIAIQGVVRTEPDYMVVRGRLTGTTEGGGFFFLPYDQIHFMGFLKPLKEADIRAMFGEKAFQEISRQETHDEAPAPADAEPVPPPEVPAPAAPAPPPAKTGDSAVPPRPAGLASPELRPGTTNKAALLERLRSRRSDSGMATPSP